MKFIIYFMILITLVSHGAENLTEDTKILRLIDTVSKSQLVFIRNGSEHTGKEAANHLKFKYDKAKLIMKIPFMSKKAITAKLFIDEVATRSSSSGELYQIKEESGVSRPLRDWLLEKLSEIEKNNLEVKTP